MFHSVRQGLQMTDADMTISKMRSDMIHWMNCTPDAALRISQINEHKFREQEVEDPFWMACPELNEQTPNETILSSAFHSQWDRYVAEMKDNAFTGGKEIMAVSEMLYINIAVWTYKHQSKTANFTALCSPPQLALNTIHLLFVGNNHYEYLDLPKTFCPTISQQCQSTRSSNIDVPISLTRPNLKIPPSSDAPSIHSQIPATNNTIYVSELLFESITAMSVSMRQIGFSETLKQHLSIRDTDPIFWSEHIESSSQTLCSIYGQDLTSAKLRCCVPVTDADNSAWLHVEILNIAIGMFVHAAQTHPTLLPTDNIQHNVPLLSNRSALVLSCDMGNAIVDRDTLPRCYHVRPLLQQCHRLFCPAWIAKTVHDTQHNANKRNHFVILDLDLQNRISYIRDSLDYSVTCRYLSDKCTQWVDKLLHTPSSQSPWNVQTPHDVFHQNNNSDCAIHVLSFLSHQLIQTDHNPEIIVKLRQKLPALLLAFINCIYPELLRICVRESSPQGLQDTDLPVSRAHSITDYCGLILDNANLFTAILDGNKKYEVRFVLRKTLPPKAVFHPNKTLRENKRWTRNIETFISAEYLGPFTSIEQLELHSHNGADLGMNHEELKIFFKKNSGKTFYLYPIHSPSESDIVWIDDTNANQCAFAPPTFVKNRGKSNKKEITLFHFPEQKPLQVFLQILLSFRSFVFQHSLTVFLIVTSTLLLHRAQLRPTLFPLLL